MANVTLTEEAETNDTSTIDNDNVTLARAIYRHDFAGQGWDDATWILTSAFIIFTMQSGFGLLESGSVSRKNEVNIMVKNAIDVLFGGLSYWAFGFGLSFGTSTWSNPFIGIGNFFVNSESDDMGEVFSSFFFHMSFATTTTTIVSGAMAERTKLETYILFSFLNTFIYCVPAHWLWADNGWLKGLGVVDVAGAGGIHLIGGVTGLMATLMLKPRSGRFEESKELTAMGSPTNALFGMFMLWWGWLGFNCGSTYGITGGKWKLAARSAVNTIVSSVSGGSVGIFLSYTTKKRKLDVNYLINGILGSLVSITAMCALIHPWEGIVIGSIGSVISCLSIDLMVKLKIDDPVGVIPVHALPSMWGLLAVGLFIREDTIENISRYNGLLYGGGWYMFGVQTVAVLTILTWTMVMAFVFLKLLDITFGLRIPLHEELLGLDLVEHSINGSYDKKTSELSGADGRILEVVKTDGGRMYNSNLRKLSRTVTMGLPFEMLNTQSITNVNVTAKP
ncbi:putative ammonium transporter 3 [Saccoglossus kowalevskii]|uniref:Ammonium transporter n=1 Tax=Saccoglossus kowalevskii TaxID=10224 RepID=A0ABM0GTF2_SACKO|nr:PREDICTED: putative ammonium transporter 3-like [Saccoglossus kowalevskii]